ncbi:hypothetical protein GLOTRDRAFT_95478 [Gloeophyllum trabeum ATCC 11539]|uniref:Uncharacterized protein n=1 Tax=Gloeophyllum trabeum (strain ATCC 11539 / FP-39264 / Madison 617) TaxID=670483 RepID=S7PY83_GLOTA|nr:uncharacterized protein GLOTRDRAFT_95478 [Gloeophyllum trabeum ATCC 11539]EPQ52596.1 hypothetical protein GLOTRDRAFT_95478 [Gloeophyllum trabeum ATCC 11539]
MGRDWMVKAAFPTPVVRGGGGGRTSPGNCSNGRTRQSNTRQTPAVQASAHRIPVIPTPPPQTAARQNTSQPNAGQSSTSGTPMIPASAHQTTAGHESALYPAVQYSPDANRSSIRPSNTSHHHAGSSNGSQAVHYWPAEGQPARHQPFNLLALEALDRARAKRR